MSCKLTNEVYTKLHREEPSKFKKKKEEEIIRKQLALLLASNKTGDFGESHKIIKDKGYFLQDIYL